MDRNAELLDSCRGQAARLIEDNKQLRAELAAARERADRAEAALAGTQALVRDGTAREYRLATERDAAEARAEAAQDECEYAQDLVIRQGNMLRAVVNALRGPPPEDMHWSVHDAQELAAAMRERAEKAEAERDALRIALQNASLAIAHAKEST